MNRQEKQKLIMELVSRLESNEEWGPMLPAHSHLLAGLKAQNWIKLEGNTTKGFYYSKGKEFLKVEYDKGKPYAYRYLKERE